MVAAEKVGVKITALEGLRGDEESKIKCGAEHFSALNNGVMVQIENRLKTVVIKGFLDIKVVEEALIFCLFYRSNWIFPFGSQR